MVVAGIRVLLIAFEEGELTCRGSDETTKESSVCDILNLVLQDEV